MDDKDIPKRFLNSRGISVEPDNRSFDELSPREQELRQATSDYYDGKGFPLKLYQKMFGGSVSIPPMPEELKNYIHASSN